ncbi:hypothetical protein LY76DRAFT_157121 [Colletotrichum caudatum]|nr:hypothetical protein LY76DRAFT_157121 [Colletotrichum caudatum]
MPCYANAMSARLPSTGMIVAVDPRISSLIGGSSTEQQQLLVGLCLPAAWRQSVRSVSHSVNQGGEGCFTSTRSPHFTSSNLFSSNLVSLRTVCLAQGPVEGCCLSSCHRGSIKPEAPVAFSFSPFHPIIRFSSPLFRRRRLDQAAHSIDLSTSSLPRRSGTCFVNPSSHPPLHFDSFPPNSHASALLPSFQEAGVIARGILTLPRIIPLFVLYPGNIDWHCTARTQIHNNLNLQRPQSISTRPFISNATSSAQRQRRHGNRHGSPPEPRQAGSRRMGGGRRQLLRLVAPVFWRRRIQRPCCIILENSTRCPSRLHRKPREESPKHPCRPPSYRT